MSFTLVLFETPAGQRYIAEKERIAAKNAELALMRKQILRLLEDRFSKIPKRLADQVRAVDDLEKLDYLLILVGKCADVNAFKAAFDGT